MDADKLARKAREEREQQFDALVQKIIDSGLYGDEDRSPDIIYDIARRTKIKSKLFKKIGLFASADGRFGIYGRALDTRPELRN